MTFQLDTSGVENTPFVSGYTEALRNSLPPEHRDAPLAPATRGRILEDCEKALADRLTGYRNTPFYGAQFWRERQANQLNGMEPRFPPFFVSLSDDGLVYLTEGAG